MPCTFLVPVGSTDNYRRETGFTRLLIGVSVMTAMPPAEVTEKLQLSKLKDRVWYVVPSCATTGEGLFEGLVSKLFLPAGMKSALT